MKRKLTLAMLLSLSAASPLAMALGLGEAEVRSTLNAPLRATLPLTDAADIPPGLLNVSVADERAFAAAGLPRTPLAASVRLAVEQRQGRLVVELTTERPVREPWLDLLLRFDWPGGQQLREVTLLLDPPDYDQMPALVVGSRRVAAPVVSMPPVAAPSAQAQAPAARPAAASAVSGDPTWVRSGDTLWAVAGRLRPDSGISMNQMMVALVEANPEVFPSGNINAMRAGFSLVVPSRERIVARSSAEADRIVAEMTRAWANRGGGAPARVALGGATSGEPVAVAAATASPPLEAAPAVEPPADAAEPAAEVVQPAEEQASAASAEEPETPRLTLLTDAQLAAEGSAPGEASEGGEDEAAGEAPSEEAGDGVTEAGEASGAPQVRVDPDLLAALYGDGELSSDERLLRLESQWLERRDALEAVQGERDQLQEELSEMRDELAILREQLAALTAGGAGVDGPGAGGIAPPGATPEERPWWGAIYQGELDRNLMLGGAGLVALLALWLAVRRHRRQEGTPAVVGAGPVRVTLPGAPTLGQPEAAGPAAAPPAAPSVQGSLPQAEAISEADIFIAYGRYDQAQELLEASLAREPERDDLRLKLLNIHLEQGNRDEAEREAARLREGGNPAVCDEVERLLARHGLPPAAAVGAAADGAAADGAAADGAAGAAAERAVFDRPAERAPRVFDAAGEEEEGGASGEAADEHTASAQAAPDADAYRRPASLGAPVATEEHEPRVEPDPEPELPSEPEPLQVTTRRLEEGGEIIDYRPPALDPSPAPRQETPMQPGIDFTPVKGGESPPDSAGDDELPQEWEVEEVSFPPLEADNGGFSPGAAPERLAEAQRLVDAGEAGRARELLAELAESDDPAIRDEARALLGRLDP
ncbi:FimV/HubP family polar landmark protein [Halomonas sp. A11-A]|uniref:FimV/HubP family polar landmark protein n=1 Tax=Halomonas sp. A11-A TaxID=2183985 RepID=UPI000D9B6AC6|nr:FimV/HubP family polar landmark protein [Halomonas sp. A11-A]PWV67819.1 pilus assembly protein FimV [Halomonas sp. A11-A]